MTVLAVEAASKDYAALCRRAPIKDYALPKMEAITIDLSVETITDSDSAEKRALEFERTLVGWSRRESWAGLTPLLHQLPDRGPPLDGEWVRSDKASTRLLYFSGVWRFITIAELDIPPGLPNSGSQTSALKQSIRLLGRKLANESTWLNYAVYWTANDPRDPSGFRRTACRFLGFGP
jgi:hypothetical protein